MVETLSNLKNNKVKKVIGGGSNGTGAQEVVERLKKFLSGMNKKRHGKPLVDRDVRPRASNNFCSEAPRTSTSDPRGPPFRRK